MKKVYSLKTKILKLLSVLQIYLFIFLNLACGLDSFYYLDPPLQLNEPYYSGSDPLTRYFSFQTNETSATSEVNASYLNASSSFLFSGTEVYYKIYNNYSTMLSVQTRVDSYTSDSTNVSSAADYLINTAKYVQLNTSSGSISPLISAVGENRYCYIRLMDYGNDSAYQNVICVGSQQLTSYSDSNNSITNIYFPRRSINSKYGFNFNSDDENNPLPVQNDEDVTYSSSSSESGTWYVDMYAISAGRDETFSWSYSIPRRLGSIAIYENDYDD